MKVSIVKVDNHVYLDGQCYTVDCSGLPDDFHALQWNGKKGEVEFVNDEDKEYKYNQKITSIAPWQEYIDKAMKEKEKNGN